MLFKIYFSLTLYMCNTHEIIYIYIYCIIKFIQQFYIIHKTVWHKGINGQLEMRVHISGMLTLARKR